MENLIKWLAIGAVGYVVAREVGVLPGGSVMTALGVQQQPQGVIAPPSPPPTTSSGATPPVGAFSADKKAEIFNKAFLEGTMGKQGGKLGFDQWNYFAASIGLPNVNWESTPASKNDRSTTYTIDEYWNFIQTRGVSGLGMLYEDRLVQQARSGGSLASERWRMG